MLYILHRVGDVRALLRASELGEELRGRRRATEREVIQRSHELAAALRQVREANARLAELAGATHEALRLVRRNSVRLLKLVNALLDFSRLEAGRIEASVNDTGDGISPDFLPHVFDRFRQSDASTTRQHGG